MSARVVFRYTCLVRQYAIVIRMERRLLRLLDAKDVKLQKRCIRNAMKEFYSPYVCPGDLLKDRPDEENCILTGDFDNYNRIRKAWEILSEAVDIKLNLAVLRGELQALISRIPSDSSF